MNELSLKETRMCGSENSLRDLSRPEEAMGQGAHFTVFKEIGLRRKKEESFLSK